MDTRIGRSGAKDTRIASWHGRGHTLPVKTAVSLPHRIFEEAECLAKRRGMSRSELYARAIAHYVAGERFMGVRERLDAVSAANPRESKLDPALEKLQSLSLGELSADMDGW